LIIEGAAMTGKRISTLILAVLAVNCKSLQRAGVSETQTNQTGGTFESFGYSLRPEPTIFGASKVPEFTVELNKDTTFDALKKAARDEIDSDMGGQMELAASKPQPNALLRFIDPVTNKEVKLDTLVSIRGHSSVQECDFPKLEIDFDTASGNQRSGTVLSDIESFDLNTHCKGEATTQKSKKGAVDAGRIGGDVLPVRENVAFKLMEIVGLPMPKSAVASFRYVDKKNQRPQVHKALIIERRKHFLKRLLKGGDTVKRIKKNDYYHLAIPMQPENFLALFGHILVGNGDHEELFDGTEKIPNFPTSQLERDAYSLWNYIAFEQSGKTFVTPIDFDLSSVVTQKLSPLENGDSEWKESPYQFSHYQDVSMFSDLLKVLPMLSNHDWETYRQHFEAIQPQISQFIGSNKDLSDSEKEFFVKRVDRFVKTFSVMKSVPLLAEDTHELFFVDLPKGGSAAPRSCGDLDEFDHVDLRLPRFVHVMIQEKSPKKGFVKAKVLDPFDSQFNALVSTNCINTNREFFLKADDVFDASTKQVRPSLFAAGQELVTTSIWSQ
jgi:hypothetical protein